MIPPASPSVTSFRRHAALRPRPALAGAVLLAFAAADAPAARSVAEPIRLRERHKVTYEKNPEGLQLGFWANYWMSGNVLTDFGKRPVDKVAFHKWNHIETEKGEYNFGPRPDQVSVFHQNEMAALNGASQLVTVSVSFSEKTNTGGIDAIPEFYPQRITHPETREAGKNFLRAYVKELLRRVGDVTLGIDIEFPWHYDFRVPSNRKEYRDWFVEACEVAREAAAEIGMEDRLELLALVNIDPTRYNKEYFGTKDYPSHEHLPWLQDIFDAADVFAMGIYEYDPADPSSPEQVFTSAKYWINNYATDKPAWIAEVGMSTILEEDPDHENPFMSHNHGNEEQQREFYARFLDQLHGYNMSELNAQLEGVTFFMYADRHHVGDELDNRFGILRTDNTRKPAWFAVKRGFHDIEDDPASAPANVASTKKLEDAPAKGAPVSFRTESGTDYETLRLRFRAEKLPLDPEEHRGEPRLRVELETPGSVVVGVNDQHWFGGSNLPVQRVHELQVWPYLYPADMNAIELQFTGQRLPFEQTVESVRWVYRD